VLVPAGVCGDGEDGRRRGQQQQREGGASRLGRLVVIAGLLMAIAVPAVRGVAGGSARCMAPLAGQADGPRGDRQDRRGRLTAAHAAASRLGGVASADGLLWWLLVQLRLWDQDGCMLQAGPSWTVGVPAGELTTAETAIRRPGAGKPLGKLMVAAHAASPGVMSVGVTPAPPVRASAIGFTLPAARGEHFFGLGERFRGPSLLGQVVDNWSEGFNDKGRRTSYSPMPLLLSSRGYGVLLATSARARFDVAATRPDAVTVRVETGALRLAVIQGQPQGGGAGQPRRRHPRGGHRRGRTRHPPHPPHPPPGLLVPAPLRPVPLVTSDVTGTSEPL
jgi:Galactose mutarotase-like